MELGRTLTGLIGSIITRWRVRRSANAAQIVLLGNTYDEAGEEFEGDFRSHVLFTYRHSFSRLTPTEYDPRNNWLPQIFRRRASFESDYGWGCTIRVFQMAAAQVLMSLLMGKNGRLPNWHECQGSELCVLANILGLFSDTGTSKFGIHQVVRSRRKLMNIQPRQWFGPTSCAQVFTQLFNQQPLSITTAEGNVKTIAAYHADSGEIPFKRVREILEGNQKPALRRVNSQSDSAFEYTKLLSKVNRCSSWPHKISCAELESSSIAVVLMVSLRLGLDNFDMTHKAYLSKCFRLKQFQGLAGGGPYTAAYYFIGCSEEGLYYLDPHIKVQEAIRTVEYVDGAISVNGHRLPCKEHTLFPEGSRELPWKYLNPSMTLIFLCTCVDDLLDMRRELVDGLIYFRDHDHIEAGLSCDSGYIIL